jgi:hypothetical protein
MNKIKAIVLIGILPIFLFSKEQPKVDTTLEFDMLRDAGAITYQISPDNAYIGFSKENKPIVAVSSKKFKSYSVITICLAVKKTDDGFMISDAKITDLNKIKDKKKNDNITNAIADLKGKQIATEKEQYKNIDAITGATRYHTAVYENGNLLAKKLMEILQKNPKPEATIAIPAKAVKEIKK